MNKMTKLISTIICTIYFALQGTASIAQSAVYGNEWINFNQSYFKFKIGSNGIYRIPFSLLNAHGLGSVPGVQFALYREGVEVPIYVSSIGTLGSTDYIEFYGSKANGLIDKELFVPVSNQANDEINIISDSAAYFLTYSLATHERLTLSPNTIASPLPIEEAYCTTSVTPSGDLRQSFSNGESQYKETAFPNVYFSGKYDKGEGFNYSGWESVTLAHQLKNIYSTNPNAQLSYGFQSNNKATSAIFRIYVNGTQVSVLPITSAYQLLTLSVPLDQAYLAATTNVEYKLSVQQEVSVLKSKISYNRNFDFTDESKLNFSVAGNSSVQLINLLNLNTSNDNILCDLSSKTIYHLGANGQLFLDPIAGNRNLFFSAAVENITEMTAVNFTDYSLAANQGTYLILSDKAFIDIPNGGVTAFANYRSAAVGGSHDVLVVEANQLYDQFAYGMDYHPVSIKHFLKFAKENAAWVNKPEYMFILGKGIGYNKVDYYTKNRSTLTYPIVPTYGLPGSDNLFGEVDNTSKPYLAIGRLSAISNQEIEAYLTKVIAYENAIKVPAVPNLENSFWKKRALHVAGSQGLPEQVGFLNYLNLGKAIIQDTAIGASVITAGVVNTDITINTTAQIDSLVGSGLQYITYFGHASASGFDYNLNNPGSVPSNPKFPIFLAFGCDVAKIFEPTVLKTISENYIHEPQGGAIAMLACTNLGWTGYLSNYLSGLYYNIAKEQYGQTLGKQYLNNITQLQNAAPNNIYTAIHSQNFLLQGDPGLSVYSPSLPDYYIDSTLVTTSPKELNVTMSEFQLSAQVHNLGKGVNQSVWVKVQKTKPNNPTVLFKDSILVEVINNKMVNFTIPVQKGVDTGWLEYTVVINQQQNPNELSFANNSVTIKKLFLPENLMPVYPEEFSIIHNQALVLKASTFNAFVGNQNFIVQVDTTEYFNSPALQQYNVSATGGAVSVPINFTLVDSTVYYWRTTVDRPVDGSYVWNKSSFIYLANGSDGWNQSHFFQYAQNKKPYLALSEPDRVFTGVDFVKNLRVQARAYEYGGENDILLNNQKIGYGTCFVGNGVIFMLFDPVFGLPVNHIPGKFPGSFGNCDVVKVRQTEFSLNTPLERQQAMNYIDSIQNNYYVMVKSNTWTSVPGASFVNDWMNDDPGGTNTLYHKFLALGLDFSFFTGPKSFIGFSQKGNPSFLPKLNYGSTPDALVNLDANVALQIPSATMTSTMIGPVASWTNLLWQADTLNVDGGQNKTNISVTGYTNASDTIGTLLFTTENRDTSLNSISASQFPYLKLKWLTQDSAKLSLPQLEYWRILHSDLPEVALNPSLYLAFEDSLQMDEKIGLKVAVQNLKTIAMDSLLVKFSIVDQNNVTTYLGQKKFRNIGSMDTVQIEMDSLLATPYLGNNVLVVEVNPDNDQLEEAHFNNIGYLPFKVVDHTLSTFLQSFDAKKRGKEALLNWNIAKPELVKVFAVQRSSDGKTFSELGSVIATDKNGYQFVDEQPLQGMNYYRLLLEATDGTATTSAIRQLNFAENGVEIKIHPNPFVSNFSIEGLTQNCIINVFDISGKLQWSQSATNKLVVSATGWAAGAYTVQVVTESGKLLHAQKIIKNK